MLFVLLIHQFLSGFRRQTSAESEQSSSVSTRARGWGKVKNAFNKAKEAAEKAAREAREAAERAAREARERAEAAAREAARLAAEARARIEAEARRIARGWAVHAVPRSIDQLGMCTCFLVFWSHS